MSDAASLPHPRPRLSGRRRLVDPMTGLLIVLVGLAPEPETFADSPSGFGIRLATLVGLALVIPLRRRFPLLLVAVCTGTLLAAPVWTDFLSGYLLALAVAVYGLALVSSTRFTLLASASAAGVLLAAAILFGTPGPHYSRFFQPVAVVGVGVAAGSATRNRRAYVAAITERAERAERSRAEEARRQVAEERLRIARDLHDAAAHQIAAINLHAGVASNALRARPDDAERSLAVIREAAHSVLDEISALLGVLRDEPDHPTRLDPLATMEGLDALIQDFGRSGLQVTLNLVGDPDHIAGAAGVVAYRVLQEGLANALKHGSGQRADVLIEVGATEALIRVANLVAPPSSEAALRTGRHGLLGIQERVGSVRGRMQAGREAGRFVLQAEIPLTAGSAP